MKYKKYYFKIIEELKKYSINFFDANLVSLVVFGSVANDTFTPESDIDILFVLETTKSKYDNFDEYYDFIENRINMLKKLKKNGIFIRINPIFKQKDKLSFNIPYLWGNKFIILYDKDNFFMNFSEKLQSYKKDNLKFCEGKIPYFEVKSGK